MNGQSILQQIAWLAGALTAVVTAWRFLVEFRESRNQRALELRWKQAEVGKSLNDEMQDNELAWAAMQMLDSDTRPFEIEGQQIMVHDSDITTALNPVSYRDEPRDRFIRDAFDTFFYYMAAMDHYTRQRLILAEDVAYPMEYYVPLLSQYSGDVEAYLTKHRLHRVKRYLDDHPAWKKALPGQDNVRNLSSSRTIAQVSRSQ